MYIPTIDEIIDIQKLLNIPATGLMDPFTESAIKNFQLKNDLDPQGKIDNETKEKLIPNSSEGLIDTDNSVSPIIKKRILKKLDPNKKDNYFDGPTKKESIFLHHTAGWENPYNVIAGWENDILGPIGTQFVIGGRNPQTLSDQWNGEIVQAFPDYGCYGWHIGIGNTSVHRNSVGIELCNFGWVLPEGKQFRSYPTLNAKGVIIRKGAILKNSEIVKLKHSWRGYEYFHRYSENQLQSLSWLIKKIGEENGIDIREGLQKRLKTFKNPFDAFDYDENIKQGKSHGLFCHTNVSPKNRFGGYEKWDLFPQDEVIEMILSL